MSFLGNEGGGTLTISDGAHTANISLFGDYLSSYWNLSSDGNGGTDVVDPIAANNWQTLDVGAGGFVDGIDIAPNGTTVVRTDTYGAYIWNGSTWQQLITATSMPSSFVTANNLSNDGQGVYEIQVAPNNSNILYMMYQGYVFESTNDGAAWTQTSFAQVSENPNSAYRMDGQKMAIDPDNANIVYVGTPNNGLFVTYNGGGTWQSVSGVPDGQSTGTGDQHGITGIVFDPALGTVGGNTNTIFAASYGNGVYESTNGGLTWASIGGPSYVEYAAVSSTGLYYVSDGSNIWSYRNGAWTELTSSQGQGFAAVAVNPSNSNEIIAQSPAGYLDVSYDAGATWSGIDWSSNQVSSSDIPWLASANIETGGAVFMSVGGLAFNPLAINELVASAGTGVWSTQLPQTVVGGTQVVWNDQSAGIEQLVANEIIVPPGGDPVLASWDRPFFYISNENAYPSSYGPVSSANIVAGWSVDYASSDPTVLVGLADWFGGSEESGISTNGGQTWTPFPTFIPGAGTNFMGGTIAASTPQNIIWAPADGNQPYYTLNGGQTWNPIALPNVTSWGSFDWAYYLDTRTVTADRVLANTFYLYYGGVGLFETTNGGVNWTEVHSGSISAADTYNSELESVPGQAGNLFFTAGPQSGLQPDGIGFYRSINQGVTWTPVANVQDVSCFGFGAAAPGQNYPSIYIVGWVNNVYGIWQSTNNALSWTQVGTYPNNSLDEIKTISGDPNIFGQVYVGFQGSGYAYLSAAPVVSGVSASPSTGIEAAGQTITLTLAMSEAVTITGAPTLSLNDGGTATYSGGSGTDALTFSYTVSTGDTPVSALAITQVNEPVGTTVTDVAGNAANFSAAQTTFSGLQIEPVAAPSIQSVAESPASGDLNIGKSVTLTLTFSGAVTVSGGTPKLTLNDGGTATYTGGSGGNALTFSYAVGAGQNISSLAATAINLNSAAISDIHGNAASLSLFGLTQTGPQIDTTAPSISSIVETPSSGDLNAGKVVTITLDMSEAVTVNTAGGMPTIALNDGGTASYVSGSGTSALNFSYTVTAGQNTPDLMETAVNLNGSTIKDGAGNAGNMSLTGIPQGSPQVDTTAPTITAISKSPSSGKSYAGQTVSLTLTMSEVVTVSGGTPSLALNDGGTATYSGGFGSNTLTFSYTVGAGQNTSSLAVSAITLNSAVITDGAGNTASLSLNGIGQQGPQIDGTAPQAPTISSSSANAGTDVVNGPTLTLAGAAAPNETVELFDGITLIGTTTSNGAGGWSYATTTAGLVSGLSSFTAVGINSLGDSSSASTPVTLIVEPAINANPSGSASALMVMDRNSTGNLEIYDVGNNAILSAYALGQFGSQWQVSGFGQFFGNSSDDMLLRNSMTGSLEVYDLSNNNITNSVALGQVGLEWNVAGFGDFSSIAGQTDILMRDSLTGAFEVYDISNNAITSAGGMGQVGSEWQVAGFGDFSGRANETDMLMRNGSTGAFEIYDISNNSITFASSMGQVGPEWQVVGFGDFSGKTNETDMLMRNGSTGVFEIYDISHNQIVLASAMGQVGLEWQVAGFGDFSGKPNETDMLMRNSSSGAFEVYDITQNHITLAASMGQVGTEWSIAGSQLIQAMASFAPASDAMTATPPTATVTDQASYLAVTTTHS